MKYTGLLSLGAIVLVAIITVSMWASYQNQEISLREEFNAKNKANEAFFDAMFKILQQKANVSSEYKESFKEIYQPLIEGRYAEDSGLLMKWIQESNPTFDASLYKDLMQSIEAERKGFFRHQAKLIDIKREHDILIKKIPSRWFLSDAEELGLKIITSSHTERTFQIGKEDDIQLFKR